MKIVVIYWKDAALHGRRTVWKDGIEELGLVELVSVGIVVKESKTQITLAMDYSPMEGSWRTLATYPKALARKIKYITIKEE